MSLKFSQIFIISETILRRTIEEPFWPNEQRTYQRQKVIDQNKREGWICDFLNQGLQLDLKILIRKNDYSSWPTEHKTENVNTIKSELTFRDNIVFELPQILLKIRHRSADAEQFRKKIYISKCFGERAHQIWAAQFVDANDRSQMFFLLGFRRDADVEDISILTEIKKTISLFDGAEIL